MTNMSAVAANLKKETKFQTSEDTFELKYNRACYFLSQGKYSEAEKVKNITLKLLYFLAVLAF